jgi:hypothetical protein
MWYIARTTAPLIFFSFYIILQWRFQKFLVIFLFLNQIFIFFYNFLSQLDLFGSLVFSTLIDKTIVKSFKLSAIFVVIDVLVPSGLETLARPVMKLVGFVLPMLFFKLLPETIFVVSMLATTNSAI